MTTTTTGSDFAALARRITAAGLMRRRPAYYLVRLGAVALMYVGGWTAFLVIGSSWWQMVTAVFLAVTFAQVASWHTTWHTVRSSAPGDPANSPGCSPGTSASA